MTPIRTLTQLTGGFAALTLLSVSACAPIQTSTQALHPLLSQVGQTVQLQGFYAGWAGCELSGAKTRNDWVLKYANQGAERCVFVTGGLPIGIVPPPSTASVGLPTRVNGTVALSEAGKPYLVFATD